jgi:hypothetical protein
MKELELNNQDVVVDVKQVAEERKEVLVNRLLPSQGHKCFQYNVVTNELSHAVFRENNLDLSQAAIGNIRPVRSVSINENCMYVTALNFKNATKRLSIILGKKIFPEIVKPC